MLLSPLFPVCVNNPVLFINCIPPSLIGCWPGGGSRALVEELMLRSCWSRQGQIFVNFYSDLKIFPFWRALNWNREDQKVSNRPILRQKSPKKRNKNAKIREFLKPLKKETNERKFENFSGNSEIQFRYFGIKLNFL